jgi:hypothetical protein
MSNLTFRRLREKVNAARASYAYRSAERIDPILLNAALSRPS